MSKSSNQKLKLLYVLKILHDETDDEHGISVPKLIERLSDMGIKAERKSIYDDFEVLRQFGVDVIGEKTGSSYTYHMGKRSFELAELKLLTDAVQSAKFITERKSGELIKKLESLAGKYEASKLQRQVFVTGRSKAENESVYYNVDLIYEAMGKNRRISFQYFNWNEKKEAVLRKKGAKYEVSPWGLLWDDENYYLVAYDGDAGMLKHYRVDKMLKTEILAESRREGEDSFRRFDTAEYSKRLFGMFGGELKRVRLECENNLAGVMIDRFGQDVMMMPLKDKPAFIVSFDAFLSPQLLGWIFGLGPGVRILGPEPLREMFKKRIDSLKSCLDNA